MAKVDELSRLAYGEDDIVRAALAFASLKPHQLKRRTLNIQHRTVKEVRRAHRWMRKVLGLYVRRTRPKYLPSITLKGKGRIIEWSKLEWWLSDVRLVPYLDGGKLATDHREVIPLSIGGLCAYAALLIAERRGKRKRKDVPRYRVCWCRECGAFFPAVDHAGRPPEYCCEKHKRKASGQ
jgi:hypothetical protein